MTFFRRFTFCLPIFFAALAVEAQPYGLAARPAGGAFLNNVMPEAAPVVSGNWSAVSAFPNLVFTNALGILPLPGTTNLVVWEREGRIWSFANSSNAATKKLVLDLSNQCQGWDDSGLLGIAFHPGFVTNRFLFVYYTWVTPGTVVGSPTVRPTEYVVGKYHDRLTRFTLDTNGVALTNELVLVDQVGDSVWHNGGGMFFHPVNGFLYWTDGDDERAPTQIINQNLLSGVFRIDVDKRGGAISHAIPRQPNNGTTTNYFIPNDNPFVGQAGVLEEFFALGLRSPHRMTYDAPSGRIFIGDVGAGAREEIDIVEPAETNGLNFQWSTIEGLQGDLTQPYIGMNKRPILDYTHSSGDGYAVIGGYVYRGSKFAADLGGKYIFGDNVTRNIWVMDESTSPASKILLCVMPRGIGSNSGSDYLGLSSFGVDANDELFFCQMSNLGGQIYQLARSGPPPASRPLPALLSQTGVFQNLAALTASNTVIPYGVNSPLWSDGAVKRRWVAVPTNTSVHFVATNEWTFPSGTVFVKHFELATNDTNPNSLRRLETRLLVRDTNGAAYGVTYKWRADNSDADLLTNSLAEDITIQTATGTRTQQWYYPSRTDCLRCHTPAAGYVLGLKTRQLNGDLAYASSGVTDNQLRAWNHISLFDTMLNEGTISNYDKLVTVTNLSASLEFRVRSYLDANCSQCHRPGGVPALWDARFDTPLANQGIVSGTVVDSLGIAGARVVYPQDLARSIMHLRLNTLDARKMPPLARNTTDSNAVSTLAQWISTLPLPTNALPNPWQHTDIGNVGIAGDAQFGGGTFTVYGGGDDIWNNADAFHFAYRPLNGDGEIIARVATLQNTDSWAKSGVMIRETLTAGSRHTMTVISMANGAAFQRRLNTSDISIHTGNSGVVPYWVRLTRTGNVFRGYASPDGSVWTLIDTDTVVMPAIINIGLVTTAHNNSALNTSTLDNVSGNFGTNQPPSVSLIYPGDTALFVQPASLTLQATASDVDGTVAKVEFLNGTNVLGVVSNAPYNLVWNNFTTTNYALRARATDNGGSNTLSSIANISIVPLKLNVVTSASTNGQFRLQFQAQPGMNYIVEMSTNLQTWKPLVTNLPVNGLFDYIDLNATNAQRFYRVRQ